MSPTDLPVHRYGPDPEAQLTPFGERLTKGVEGEFCDTKNLGEGEGSRRPEIRTLAQVHRGGGPLRAIALMAVFELCGAASVQAMLAVSDVFGRDLTTSGVVLIDFEGYMANPAMRYFISPPAGATFPGSAIVSADNARIYFNEPSTVGASGPGKTLTFNDTSPVEIYITIFPDRDLDDETHTLSIQFTDSSSVVSNLDVDISVVDQDLGLPLDFGMTVDYSEDMTGFFGPSAPRDVLTQAAEDWAYFINDMILDEVAAGAESSFIWDPVGLFVSGMFVTNSSAYTGFLLYAHGVDNVEKRSGGQPSLCCFQTSSAVPLSLRRSGVVSMETEGNFNTLGWFFTTSDDDWHTSQNFAGEVNDFYSIAHHEIGHALIFNPGYPVFDTAKMAGALSDPDVVAYLGGSASINASDHFAGVIDPVSHKGVFGAEYDQGAVAMPRRRWLITKFDLLVARAIGYDVRQVTALTPLSLDTSSVPNAILGQNYSETLTASGGVAFYRWTLDSGTLPDGLSVNAITGEISGIPTATGIFNFSLGVQEYDAASVGVTQAFSIEVSNLAGVKAWSDYR